MEIDLQTRIGALLEAYPQLEETLLELSPAFAKLSNPVLRRTVARVTSIQQAARIAGISPVEMVRALRKAAGLPGADSAAAGETAAEQPENRPEWFDEAAITVRFDATPAIESGQSPMSEILRLSKGLDDGRIMELTAPFRPEPIIDLLKSNGFRVWYGNGKTYILKQ